MGGKKGTPRALLRTQQQKPVLITALQDNHVDNAHNQLITQTATTKSDTRLKKVLLLYQSS